MKKIKFILVAVALLLAGSTIAQNKVADSAKIDVPDNLEMLQTANQLAKYGYKNGNPLSLIQAAELYATVNPGVLDASKSAEGTSEESTKQETISFDVDKLLADATILAEGDANLLAIIDNIKNSATRGATGSGKHVVEKVNAKTTDVYHIRFRGHEDAIVVVSGDGDTDLDLYIYDENDNLIDSDTDLGDACVCTFRPAWTGTFTIKVKNLGNVYNRYELATN